MDDKNAIRKIIEWRDARNLQSLGFDHTLQVSFIIEELLESTGRYTSSSARKKAFKMAKEITEGSSPTDEQITDAFADIVVYAIGAVAAVGYDPEKVMEEVQKELDSRKGKVINGKFEKDENTPFYKANFTNCKSSQ